MVNASLNLSNPVDIGVCVPINLEGIAGSIVTILFVAVSKTCLAGIGFDIMSTDMPPTSGLVPVNRFIIP